ncbi:MAG: LL-diaminopimelate aminotransferase [Bacteroidales bacterium]|nr:LL-diaminopimelate aminotransferase [Bacteroidales bacterium]MDY6427650.1 LL-diaminopimelate aminotransferase [Bacteroidales bacterium]
MVHINNNFTKLSKSYLFSEIERKVGVFKAENPDKSIIRMGIGDVTLPLPNACIEAMHKAVDEMGSAATFRGYGPEQGYLFLRDKICEYDYKPYGVNITPDEVFVSDGAKSDTGNITDILGSECRVAVTDPVYPVYVDTNVMAGRTDIVYMPCTAENGFVPELPKENVDVIYLCYPNNPTGTSLKRSELKCFVDYAIEHKALILFDAAYETYISNTDVPHSIYEIDGAERVAIEFRSYSKTAGFTGTRCSYTVVPKTCVGYAADGTPFPLNEIWNRRQCTKFNGTPYIIQRAAEAIYSDRGWEQVKQMTGYYKANAAVMRNALETKGYKGVYGGVDSPYVWLKTPDGMSSWSFFDYMLSEKGIVCTPGVGFGRSGEGYVRLTAFNTTENTIEAMNRL